MPGSTPPRLTVLAARDADVAVVLRRGPSAWARLSLWDTATDTVTHGSWVRARVYERRCDLSPDGRLFVAFVAAFGRAARGEDTPHAHESWVAVSRPPWFTALALWWNGTAWDLGGVFPDAASCTLGGAHPDVGSVPRWFDTSAPLLEPRPGPAWTDLTVPHNRRLRDGWRQLEDGWWERPLASGAVAVTREHVGHDGRVLTEHALRLGEELTPLGAGASLDVDRRGRALVAREGRLEVHPDPGTAHVVADLTGQQPDPAPPPAWASTWPDPPAV